MEFVGIIGNRGSGKTNLLTKYLYEASKDGQKVIANYSLNFRATAMSFEEIRKLGPEIEDAVIGLDELGVGADSYDFMSKESKHMTTLIAQIRKRHCRVMYTVQRWSMIARRLRLQTDGFIFMQDMDAGKLVDGSGKPVDTHREVCAGRFKAVYADSDGVITRKPRIFDGRKYWGMYNTDEIIWA